MFQISLTNGSLDHGEPAAVEVALPFGGVNVALAVAREPFGSG